MRMRAVWVFIVWLGASPAPALAQTTPSAPEDHRIAAFRSVCIEDRHSYRALQARAVSEEWQLVARDHHPELAALLERSEALDLDEDMDSRLASYGRSFGSATLYLLLTRLESAPVTLVSCYVYDFEATGPIAPAPVSDWLGISPTDTIDQPGVIVGHTWAAPEALPGTWDIFLSYVPDDGPAADETGFSGIVLKITAIEPRED
ncbi:hypothetical protein [Bauldia sp.]|uniref:hypothetical protein n=1 Tax=Bauldia sp. TaxID=2575872 RepID=UPI003BAA2DB4